MTTSPIVDFPPLFRCYEGSSDPAADNENYKIQAPFRVEIWLLANQIMTFVHETEDNAIKFAKQMESAMGRNVEILVVKLTVKRNIVLQLN